MYTRDPARAAELADGLADDVLTRIETAVPLPPEWVLRTVPRAPARRAAWIIERCDDPVALDALAASVSSRSTRRALTRNPRCVLYQGLDEDPTPPPSRPSPVPARAPLSLDDGQIDHWLTLAGSSHPERTLEALRLSVTTPDIDGRLLPSLLRYRHLPGAPRNPRYAPLLGLPVSDREVLEWACSVTPGREPLIGPVAARALSALASVIREIDGAARCAQPVVPFDESVAELLVAYRRSARVIYGTRAANWATPEAQRLLVAHQNFWPVFTLREVGLGYTELPLELLPHLGHLVPDDATPDEVRGWADAVLSVRLTRNLQGLPAPDVIAPALVALDPPLTASLLSKVDRDYRLRLLCTPVLAEYVTSPRFPSPLFLALAKDLAWERLGALDLLLTTPSIDPLPATLLARHTLRHVPGLAAQQLLHVSTITPIHEILYALIESSPATPAEVISMLVAHPESSLDTVLGTLARLDALDGQVTTPAAQ